MKSDPFYSFLAIFIGLISMVFAAHVLIFPDVFINYNFATNFSCSIALVSLTQGADNIFISNLPNSYIYFLLIVIQVSGTALLSYLLYYCWKLFGEKAQKSMTLKSAFVLTSKISLMIEGGLLLFFLYAIPIELTNLDLGQKIVAALSLAVNSFFAAGFTYNACFFHEGTIDNNFLIQIGIVGGTTIGGLGVFVIYELFSPIKLRERLADPKIDWTFITKISVFGGALVIGLGAALVYFFKADIYWPEKNMIETVIASIYQISSARGFGFSIAPMDSWIESAVHIFGAGPFSTGGGLTLLFVVWFINQKKPSKSMNLANSKTLTKWLAVFTLILFTILTSLLVLLAQESATKIILDQLALFTTNNFALYSSDLAMGLQAFTNFLGRIGFLLMCFLILRKHEHQKSLQNP